MNKTTLSFELTRLREAIYNAEKEMFILEREELTKPEMSEREKHLINDRLIRLQEHLEDLNVESELKKAQLLK